MVSHINLPRRCVLLNLPGRKKKEKRSGESPLLALLFIRALPASSSKLRTKPPLNTLLSPPTIRRKILSVAGFGAVQLYKNTHNFVVVAFRSNVWIRNNNNNSNNKTWRRKGRSSMVVRKNDVLCKHHAKGREGNKSYVRLIKACAC